MTDLSVPARPPQVTPAIRRLVSEMQGDAWLEYRGPDYQLHIRLTEGVEMGRMVRWATVKKMREMGLLAEHTDTLSKKARGWE